MWVQQLFARDAVTAGLLTAAIVLLALVVVPILFALCRLRDVGPVRRIHPILLAQHILCALAAVALAAVRAVAFASAGGEAITYTTTSCQIFFTTVRTDLRAWPVKRASRELWACVRDAYCAPLQLIVSRPSSPPALAHPAWWHRVHSVAQPAAQTVVESLVLVLLIATFIHVLMVMWQDAAQSVEAAIRRGDLSEYTRRTHGFLRQVPSLTHRTDGTSTSASTRSGRPFGPGDGANHRVSSAGEAVATPTARVMGDIANDLFAEDSNTNARSASSARARRPRARADSVSSHSTSTGLVSSSSGSSGGGGSSPEHSDPSKRTELGKNSSFLHSSVSTLWRSLRLPRFRAPAAAAETAPATAATTEGASHVQTPSPESPRHVTFGRSPLDPGDTSGPLGSSWGLSTGSRSGRGLSFGSASDVSTTVSGASRRAGEVLTLRPRLNVHNLALQQRLLKAQEKQKQRQKHDRRARHARELLASFWVSPSVTLTLTAIPFLLVCACRTVLLLVSSQISQGLGTSPQFAPSSSSPVRGWFSRVTTGGALNGTVVFLAPVEGYLGLAGAIVLAGDAVSAARLQTAVRRLHHNKTARAAIPQARPALTVTGVFVTALLTAQLCPQSARMWATTALSALVCLSLTTMRLTLWPILHTVRQHDPKKKGYSRLALLLSPFLHPVETSMMCARKDAEALVNSAQERRRTRRVALATQAATAAVTAMTDASNGNPMAAEDAASRAAQAAHQLLREELEDEVTGGVAGVQDVVDAPSPGSVSPLDGSMTQRGGAGNNAAALREALAYAATAVANNSFGSEPPSPAFGAEDTTSTTPQSIMPPPLGGLSATGLRKTSSVSTAKAATNFWENIASHVHQQYTDADRLTTSSSTVTTGAAMNSTVPALLGSVEGDANNGEPLTDDFEVSSESVFTGDGADHRPPAAMMTATSAAVASAMMPAVPAEVIPVSDMPTADGRGHGSGSETGEDGVSTLSYSDGPRPSNASFRTARLSGQFHRHVPRSEPASVSEAIAMTALGDLHGSMLLKPPMAVASTASPNTTQPSAPAGDHDDPLHTAQEGPDRDGGTGAVAEEGSDEDGTDTTSSLSGVLRKSFAFLARPAEWLGLGDGDKNNDASDETAAAGRSGDGVAGSMSPTDSGAAQSSQAWRQLPALVLDPPSDTEGSARDGGGEGPHQRLAEASAATHALSRDGAMTLSDASATTNTQSSSALSESGPSAAVVATAMKAARALRAVSAGSPDEGFPLFLSAVRHSGNNVTLLRELMLPTGTRYVHMADDDGRTALHHAALGNHVHGIAFLLEMGAQPNARDVKGLTPLHLAVITQCEHAVAAEIDDDPSGTTKQRGRQRRRRGPLLSRTPHAPIAAEAAASTGTATDEVAETVAGYPAKAEAVAAIKLSRRPHRTWRGTVNALVRGGADVNAVTNDGRTPLHMAIANELIGVLQTLLREGADPLALWEDEDAVESRKPGGGRWVYIHLTHAGVVAGDGFHKSPLLYALEVGSSMGVASMLAFTQLEEEMLRVDQALQDSSKSPTRPASSSQDAITTLTTLLRKGKKSVTHDSPSSPMLAATRRRVSDTVIPTSSGVSRGATITPTDDQLEAVKMSALVTPSQRRRRVVAKSRVRAVARTVSAVEAAVAAAEAEHRRRTRTQTRSQKRLAQLSEGCARAVAEPPLTTAGGPSTGAACTATGTVMSTKPVADALALSLGSNTSSRRSTNSTAATMLNDLAGAWSQHFMPLCVHGLSILEVALALGQTNVVRTIIRHHVLWCQQQSFLREDSARRRRIDERRRRASRLGKSCVIEDRETDAAGDGDDAAAMDEVDDFVDSEPSDQDECGSLRSSHASHHSGSTDGRRRRRDRRRAHAAHHRRRHACLTEDDYHAFVQRMWLPPLTGSGVNVLPEASNAAAAYAPEPLASATESTIDPLLGPHPHQDAPSTASARLSVVGACASASRLTLFHYLAVGDSTEATAYVLEAAGMPDFVPGGDPFSGLDTAWRVQHPHHARDAQVIMQTAATGGSEAGGGSNGSRSLAATVTLPVASGGSSLGVSASTTRHAKSPTVRTLAPHLNVSGESSPLSTLVASGRNQRRRELTSGGERGTFAASAAVTAGSDHESTGDQDSQCSSSGSNHTSHTSGIARVVALMARQRQKVIAEKESQEAAARLHASSEFGDSFTAMASPGSEAALVRPGSPASPNTQRASSPHSPAAASSAVSAVQWRSLSSQRTRRAMGGGRDSLNGSRRRGSLNGSHGVPLSAPPRAGRHTHSSASGSASLTDSFSPWRHARQHIDEHRGQARSEPAFYDEAPNLIRAVPMGFNAAVVKLRQKVPSIPIDLPHLTALEAAVDHVCRTSLDVSGKETRRVQRALLVVSLRLQQQLLEQRARRRRAEWHPRGAGSSSWRPQPLARRQPRQRTSAAAEDPAPTEQQVRASVDASSGTEVSAQGSGSASAASPKLAGSLSLRQGTLSSGQSHGPASPLTPPPSPHRLRIAVARVKVGLNCIDAHGLTPLHYVIANHNPNLVFVLCCHGAVFTFASAETRLAVSGDLSQLATLDASACARGEDTSSFSTPGSAVARMGDPIELASVALSEGSGGHSTSRPITTAAAAAAGGDEGNDETPRDPARLPMTAAGGSSLRTARSSQVQQDSHHSGSSPGSMWIDASAIPALVDIPGSRPAVDGNEGAREAADEDDSHADPLPAVVAADGADQPLSGTAQLPSTPQLDSFLRTAHPVGEERLGLRRVSTPGTAEARALLQEAGTPKPTASVPAATAVHAKPPLAPSAPTESPVRHAQGLAASAEGRPLVELYPPPPSSPAAATAAGAAANARAGVVDITASQLGRGRSGVLSALEETEAVRCAGKVLQRCCEARAAQLPAGVREALDVVGESRSARRLLEALEALTHPATAPLVGDADAEQQERAGVTEAAPADSAERATPPSAPLTLSLAPGELLVSHDIFTLHVVRDPVKAASLIYAALEGMAVWERKSRRLAEQFE